MVNNINELFTILQRSYKKKKKKCIILNKELNEILVIVNGISQRLYSEYLLNNLKYDELEKYMNKLENIYNIYVKIKLPISIKRLNEDIINNYIYSIKYLLHNIIKKCGAKNCSHIMQIFFSKNWFNALNRGYIHLFKLYNRLFIPKNVRIVNKNSDNIISLPYAQKLDITNDDFIMALNGAELVCPLLDKDIIVSGYFITDPLTNISQEKQMKSKYIKLVNSIKNNYNSDFFINYLKQISLRDFIVLSVNDIIKQIDNDYIFLQKLKKDNLPSIIRVFLQSNLYTQHKIISLFLLDTIDSKFMAHIIFDMLYTDNGISSSIPNGSILYKNLHWTLQKNFKKTYNQLDEYKKKINKLTTEKIPYETKIIAVKASNEVKEKAIEKLKEFNSSKDGSISAKCAKYLDGFLKIPFGLYREECIITFLENFKNKLNNILKNNKVNIKSVTTASEINNLLELQKNSSDFNLLNQEWSIYKNKKLNYMNFVRKTLDNCVYGHNVVKKQLERVIAQWINGKNDGTVLGLLGPPGIGKTCLIKHGLSKCLIDENGNKRPFAFIPLGGSTNSSYLVGHSYTYVGSTWGKIIDILMDSKCMNPIIFFDELDKVSNTEHGREIISILTHLTDSTQNSEFCDKFFTGIKFDLSKCLIIFTYNDIHKIDRILRDRITTIELKSLNKQDKIIITKKYLLPEILNIVGFSMNDIIFEDESIEYIIDCYTYEAGVRKLKEKLFEIIREINLSYMTQSDENISLPFYVTKEYVTELFIDKAKVRIKKISNKPRCGIVNGLYATEAGVGGLTIIQVFRTITDSKEIKLEYTGNQGDVMKESIKCAKTIAWNIIPAHIKNKIKDDWETNGTWGLHIHCPDTSTPKDGPSAGGAITLAIISNLCNIEVKNTVAMTGEIDLNGNITAIGGVQSKLEGAISAGATLALLPKENQLDYKKIKDKLLVEGETDKYRIEVKFLETIYDILEVALVEDHGIDFIDLKN